MFRLIRGLSVSFFLLLASVKAIADPSASTEVLLQSSHSWDGQPYQSYPERAPELSIVKITIPPHTALPWHTHPMPNAAYILSGELTVEKKEGGQTVKLSAGQVSAEMVGALHRGVTGDVAAVLIVFYAGTHGMPFSLVENAGQ